MIAVWFARYFVVWIHLNDQASTVALLLSPLRYLYIKLADCEMRHRTSSTSTRSTACPPAAWVVRSPLTRHHITSIHFASPPER